MEFYLILSALMSYTLYIERDLIFVLHFGPTGLLTREGCSASSLLLMDGLASNEWERFGVG